MAKENKQPLISIITPVFNAEKFLAETIESVQAQTYKNWELLLVNDGSKDNSLKIAKEYAKKDKRIKVYSIKNSGAAVARNTGTEKAKGDYVCFIDADDLWGKEKLKKQLKFMQEKKCAFSFTGYEFADKNGRPNGKKVHIPEKMAYRQALKNTTISTITVMFDMQKLNKSDVYMPNVEAEDTATWWKVLKKVDYAYGLNEILSYYRRSDSTRSSNKIKAARKAWKLYRENEKFGIIKSLYYFSFYAINAVRRRV